jgi:aldehyde dehydrogenase (NAD+)
MKDDLCQAIKADLGRGEFYAYISEVFLCVTEIDHTLSHLKSWMEDEVVDTPMMCGPGTSSIHYEPLGVVLVMGAWNYPLYTSIGPLS